MENASLPIVTVERFYLNQAEKLQLKLVRRRRRFVAQDSRGRGQPPGTRAGRVLQVFRD